jgi:aspartate racemase
MGPAATLALYKRILALTSAERDQDHLHVIIDSNPKIPDRTAAILGKGESPLPMMTEGARSLERAGAHFIVIPCNTAHHWLAELRDAVSIPIIDMVSETAAEVAGYTPPFQKVALLATTGTIETALYQQTLAEKGITVLVPTMQEQDAIMDVIHRIKGKDHVVKGQILPVVQSLLDQGAQGLILGCTELSLVVEEGDLRCPLFDPLAVLARRAVEWARQGE